MCALLPRATASWFAFFRGMVMKTGRRVILALNRMDSIYQPGDSLPRSLNFFNAQVPALAEAALKALSPITGPITDLMPLTRVEGLL